jgi:hypothetical protein
MPLMGLSSLSSSYPGSAKHRHIQKEYRSTDAIDYLCACLELVMLMMLLMLMMIYTANEIVPPASSLATWYWKYTTTRSGTSAVVDTVPEVV